MNGAAVIQPAPIPFYTVLVLYLGIMAFIGWYAGRKTNNIGDFFVLSGKAGVVVSGIAYFSTQFSMGTFLGTPGTIYGVGRNGYFCTWSCVLHDSSGSSDWPQADCPWS